MGGITSLILTVNGGTYIASGETTSGTAFKARTNAPGNVSASYLAVGKWKYQVIKNKEEKINEHCNLW